MERDIGMEDVAESPAEGAVTDDEYCVGVNGFEVFERQPSPLQNAIDGFDIGDAVQIKVRIPGLAFEGAEVAFNHQAVYINFIYRIANLPGNDSCRIMSAGQGRAEDVIDVEGLCGLASLFCLMFALIRKRRFGTAGPAAFFVELAQPMAAEIEMIKFMWIAGRESQISHPFSILKQS